MNNLYDLLETCLQELESGTSLETLLARYPKQAEELRPMLEASLQLQEMAAPPPAPEVVHRGRAKLLQRAAVLREAKAAPRKRVIPLYQRLAISLGLVAGLMTTGTGLVSASSNSLPGETLYPVKRSWEDLQLAFVFNPQAREALVNHFQTERLDEVNELLAVNRDEDIHFTGVFMQVNGTSYVSGIPVTLPASMQTPVDGTAVTVMGRTDSQGTVQINTLQALPTGVIVPLGQPVESESSVEAGSDLNPGNSSNGGTGTGSESEAPGNNSNLQIPTIVPPSSEMKGTVQTVSSESVVINGQTILLNGVNVIGELVVGANVEVKGHFDQNSQFIVTEIKVEDQGSSLNNSDINATSRPNLDTNTPSSKTEVQSNTETKSEPTPNSSSDSSSSSSDSNHTDGSDGESSGGDG